jgi:hypothetical protein
VGLGCGLGGADASGLAAPDGIGPGDALGTEVSQAARSAAITAIETAGSLRRARTARIGGAEAAGTTAMVGPRGVDRLVASEAILV